MSPLRFGAALESKILSQICEQDDTMAFVFPPVEILPEAPDDSLSKEFPDEENIQVNAALISFGKDRFNSLKAEF